MNKQAIFMLLTTLYIIIFSNQVVASCAHNDDCQTLCNTICNQKGQDSCAMITGICKEGQCACGYLEDS